MNVNLQKLIDLTRGAEMTPQELEAQRRSFAYGSALIENSNITRDSIHRAAEEMASGAKQVVDQRSVSEK